MWKVWLSFGQLTVLTALPTRILPSEVDSLSCQEVGLLCLQHPHYLCSLLLINSLLSEMLCVCKFFPTRAWTAITEGMFTKGNFFRYFCQTVLLTLATTSSSLLQTLSTTIAPPVMHYLCECHILISLHGMFSLPTSTLDIYCAWVWGSFLLLDFFVVVFYFFRVQHLFLSENKLQFAFGKQCLLFFFHGAHVSLVQVLTYAPPNAKGEHVLWAFIPFLWWVGKE